MPEYLRDVLGDIILVGKLHGRCTYMVKRQMGSLNIESKSGGRGARQVHQMVELPVARRGLVVPAARASGCTYMAEPLP